MQSQTTLPSGVTHIVRGARAWITPVLVAAMLGAALPSHSAPAARPTPPKTARACAGPEDVSLDFVAADINDVLKALSLQTHTNVVSGNDVKGTITVSLNHVTLDEALDMITRLSGFQYAKVGRTYVVGAPASIAALTASGTAQAPPVTAVLSFNYSDATDLTSLIKDRFPNVKAAPGKTAGSQSGGVLVVTGSQADVDAVRQVVADSESALSRNIAASQTVVYDIKYASADDLQSVLGRLVPSLIVTPGPTQGFRLQAPSSADAGDASGSSTTTYGSTAATSPATSVTASLPTKPNTSSLLLTGSDAEIARARQILASVDTRPAQITYEAKITEVNLNSLKQFGLNYDFTFARTDIGEQGTPGQLGNGPDYSGTTKLTNPTGLAGTFAGKIIKFGTFARSPISNLVTVKLDALVRNGNAKILSEPNISAVDGQPAATFVGDTVRYIESITQTPTGQTVTTGSVNVGIKLYVTGKVNNDGYVTLNIHPEVSLITGYLQTAGGGSLPQVSTREATTTVRVKDGDTLAISGLISDQDVRSVQKVPLLGDLPFIGGLFRDVNHNHNRNEVVIFVKVSVSKDGAVSAS